MAGEIISLKTSRRSLGYDQEDTQANSRRKSWRSKNGGFEPQAAASFDHLSDCMVRCKTFCLERVRFIIGSYSLSDGWELDVIWCGKRAHRWIQSKCTANQISKDLSKLSSSAERWRRSILSFWLLYLMIPISLTYSWCLLTYPDEKDQTTVEISIDEAKKV